MKPSCLLCAFFVLYLFTTCREPIHIDLNEADPQYVIEAEITNLSREQRIRISRTVGFHTTAGPLPVENAQVAILDNSRDRTYNFTHTGNGVYVLRRFMPVSGRNYRLHIEANGEVFGSEQVMPAYIEVDSVGIVDAELFDETYYFATFKFYDPAGRGNYYRYDISVNGSPFRFASVFNDKLSDGLYVSHQITDFDANLKDGDNIAVRRSIVDKSVFDYWNEFQNTNPTTAAPGNPKSNISNNALGYFSVAPTKEYAFHIRVDNEP